MSWRVAASLLQLRDQVSTLLPMRSRKEDGTIGDEAHQHEHSDHNPDAHGVVRAMDLTHDPAHGFDSYIFAEMLRINRDPRLSYVISNRRIWSHTVAAYEWRRYNGRNPHDKHIHISVVADTRADDKTPWKLDVTPTPPKPTPPAPPPPPAPKPPIVTSRFDVCLRPLLVHEGSNDDDPRDPGGRTSRGVTQSEYNNWRVHHPGLPHDVWNAPQDQIAAIYREQFWDAMLCGELRPGVDYAVFDYGVNSGISRSAKVLQECVRTTADGHIGPLTITAAAAAEPKQLINAMCDERLAFLRRLGTWDTFGRGWSTRVSDVRRVALAMTEEAVA